MPKSASEGEGEGDRRETSAAITQGRAKANKGALRREKKPRREIAKANQENAYKGRLKGF